MRVVRAAVVGHVEWIEFLRVEHVPRVGEIVHADETWEQAGGGGGVAAVQLSLLADGVLFFTALGSDELGRRAKIELEERGVEVCASFVELPQRRGITYVDGASERTITTVGPRLEPRGHDDSLPWHELARCDAVYFCAGDADALRHARRARVLVATARVLGTLRRGAVELDAVVGSGKDEAERYRAGDLDPEYDVLQHFDDPGELIDAKHDVLEGQDELVAAIRAVRPPLRTRLHVVARRLRAVPESGDG